MTAGYAIPRGNVVKRCWVCGCEKTHDQFHRDGRSKDGRQGRCKTCVTMLGKKRRKLKGDELRAKARGKYHEDPAKERARNREYKKANPEKVREQSVKSQRSGAAVAASIKWQRAHREKKNAHDALHYAVKTGKLTKPATCERCAASSVRLQGHHHDYSRRLDVVWLCSRCHGEEHRAP